MRWGRGDTHRSGSAWAWPPWAPPRRWGRRLAPRLRPTVARTWPRRYPAWRAWLWGLAAAARAILLPASEPVSEGSPYTSVGLIAFILAAGAGAGLIATTIAMPAAAGVMTFPRSALTGGSLALVTASGAWAAVALAGPLLVAAAIVLTAMRAGPVLQVNPPSSPPRPLFEIPGASLPGRAWALLSGLRLPPEYRSLFSPTALDAAVARGEPWLWIAATVALVVVAAR